MLPTSKTKMLLPCVKSSGFEPTFASNGHFRGENESYCDLLFRNFEFWINGFLWNFETRKKMSSFVLYLSLYKNVSLFRSEKIGISFWESMTSLWTDPFWGESQVDLLSHILNWYSFTHFSRSSTDCVLILLLFFLIFLTAENK